MTAKKLITLFLSLVIISTSLPAATLHAILVINTEDEGIGCIHDYNNWVRELNTIKDKTGIKVVTYVFKDNNWGRSAVMDAVSNVSVGSDDVVLFYYSGHGLRLNSTEDVWPVMALQGHVGLEQAWAFSKLKNKCPRLLLVMADCCNNILSSYDVITDRMGTRSSVATENYKKLFLEASGTIISSGCIPGQFSYGGGSGGAYTNQFLAALHDISLQNDCNWEKIMEAACAPIYGGDQQPQYRINVVDNWNSYSNTNLDDLYNNDYVDTTSTDSYDDYYTDSNNNDYGSDDYSYYDNSSYNDYYDYYQDNYGDNYYNSYSLYSLDFYEANNPGYTGYYFYSYNATYIGYNLWLYKAYNDTSKVSVTAYYYYPDGSELGHFTKEYQAQNNYNYLQCYWTFGWNEPGHWYSGYYYVDIYVNNQYLTTGSFYIQ